MKKNLGNVDRIIRLCLAGILALLWFQNILPSPWSIIALSVAAVFAVTGFVSWCPIYAMFGLRSTAKNQPQ